MQQEDLSRAGVRHLSELERAYYQHIGFQPELTRLLAQEEGGGILLSTDLGLLSIKPKESRPNVVVVRIDGHAPRTDEEYKLVMKTVDDFRRRVGAP